MATHPEQLGSHEPGPTGERDVRAEGKALMASSVKEARPRKTPAPANDQNILSAVRYVNLQHIPRLEISKFVPNSHMLYTVLFEMEQILNRNRYFSSQRIRYSPLDERIYYGIVFYIQILRCMEASGILTPHLRHLLRDIRDQLDFERIVISGPLVPFFKALCAMKAPYEEYGMITPFIPATPGATDQTSHALAESLRVFLPNLIGLRRGRTAMLRVANRNALHPDGHYHDSTGARVQVGPAAANEQSRDARVMPGTLYPLVWNQRQLNEWQSEPTHVPIPDLPRLAGDLSWREVLGFTGNDYWFGELMQTCSISSQYWKGTTNLESISPTNGLIGIYTVYSNANYFDRDTHRDEQWSTFNHACHIESLTGDIEPPADRYAALTQINFVPAPNFCPIDDNPGSIGTTRFGPWWNIAPTRLTTVEFDPSTMVPAILAQDYALDRPAPN